MGRKRDVIWGKTQKEKEAQSRCYEAWLCGALWRGSTVHRIEKNGPQNENVSGRGGILQLTFGLDDAGWAIKQSPADYDTCIKCLNRRTKKRKEKKRGYQMQSSETKSHKIRKGTSSFYRITCTGALSWLWHVIRGLAVRGWRRVP